MTSIHAPGIYMNQQVNILLQQQERAGRIRSANHPLPYTAQEQKDQRLRAFFASTINVMLGFGFVAGFTLSYVVLEREQGLKIQQFVSGVRVLPYWMSFYLYDMVCCMITCGGVLGVLCAFDVVYLIDTRFEQMLFTVLTLIVFSFAQVPFVYLISNVFNNSSSALLLSLFFNLILSPVLLVLLFSCEAFLLPDLEDPLEWLNELVLVVHWLMRFVPVFGMGDALLQTVFLVMRFESDPPDLKLPEDIAKCVEEANLYQAYLPSCSVDLWDFNGPFKNLIVLIACAVIYPAIVLLMDYMRDSALLRRISKSPTHAIDDDTLRDADVLAEENRIASMSDEKRQELALCVSNLRRVYAKNSPWFLTARKNAVHAVQGISFGVARGEVFGLLGINGAGKSTTFNMLMGIRAPTDPDSRITLMGIDNPKDARHHIGYCPQDNTLFSFMTCQEHLIFYGRIKGICASELYSVCRGLLEVLNLTEYGNKLAGNLSGGNKRKLCVAIALIGSPPLIFLDEPSSGVDPMARRFMWSIVQKLTTGNRSCSVILTTHSMEECEALSTRCVIMVNGVFRCID